MDKEDRIEELLDNYFFGLKMIARGEATEEELKGEFDEIDKELKKLGYCKDKKQKYRKHE
jgi:hypothetical protein